MVGKRSEGSEDKGLGGRELSILNIRSIWVSTVEKSSYVNVAYALYEPSPI